MLSEGERSGERALSEKGVTADPTDLDDECVIPKPIPASALNHFVLAAPEHEERHVKEYVELEAHEAVVRLEKIKTEWLFGREMAVWDVQTEAARWWVITNPTNLYSQEIFQSLDYTLSFHVGVTTRMFAHDSLQAADAGDDERDRTPAAWRRWTQAAEALNQAREADDIQAVGVRCRECLLDLARAIADEGMVPEDEQAPKRADCIAWSGLIANHVAPGEGNRYVRGHLKAVAKSAWELVGWLTHATNATRFDGQFVLDATRHVLDAYGAAVVRHERGAPARCPNCASYRLASDYRPDLGPEDSEVMLCAACGWSEVG